MTGVKLTEKERAMVEAIQLAWLLLDDGDVREAAILSDRLCYRKAKVAANKAVTAAGRSLKWRGGEPK